MRGTTRTAIGSAALVIGLVPAAGMASPRADPRSSCFQADDAPNDQAITVAVGDTYGLGESELDITRATVRTTGSSSVVTVTMRTLKRPPMGVGHSYFIFFRYNQLDYSLAMALSSSGPATGAGPQDHFVLGPIGGDNSLVRTLKGSIDFSRHEITVVVHPTDFQRKTFGGVVLAGAHVMSGRSVQGLGSFSDLANFASDVVLASRTNQCSVR